MTGPALDAVYGHGTRVALLKQDLESGRPHHAYLLVGPPGIGKDEIATAMARAIACPVDPWRGCGTCWSCLHASKPEHPDVTVLTPDEGFLRIEQIREARARMADSPTVSPKRVFLFLGLETIKTEGANALLKVLEEPPPSVVFVMTASGLGSIPGTVLSRCRVVEFTAMTGVEAALWLVKEEHLAPADAEFFSSVLDGGPRRYRQWREAWGDKVLTGRIIPVLANPVAHSPEKLFDLSKWIDAKALKDAETGQEKRERVLLLLEVIAGLLATCIAIRAGVHPPHPMAETIIGGPLAPFLEEAWEQVRRARALVDANGNMRMTLDRLWLRLQIMTLEKETQRCLR